LIVFHEIILSRSATERKEWPGSGNRKNPLRAAADDRIKSEVVEECSLQIV